MAGELDLRLLRHFVAVAEELHFTRAAARLYVAQQALSRDIGRLERQLGVRLFTRTTRRVALTAEGERLLVRARELLALHDQTLQELSGHDRPLLVDLLAEGHTPVRVVHAARQRVPNVELVGRFHGGLGAALHLLLAGGLDVAFGRSEGLGRPFPDEQLCRRLVRLEPLALLLPEEHPLVALEAVPMEALRGTQVDISAGNEQAPEWVDLGARLLAAFGAEPSPPHPHAEGLEETVRHLRAEGLPILTLLERPVAPGVVVRPLTEPMPLYPWTMVFRRDLRHPGLDGLQASADELARRERWLELPPGPWLPESDTAVFGLALNILPRKSQPYVRRLTMGGKPDVRVGRVYDEPEPDDGTRVLVDRIWPRGLAKDKARLDQWCKQVAPSTELRKWYSHDPERFEEFGRRYREELKDAERAQALKHLRELAKSGTLTLLTATKHAEISEAAVLADLIRG
jgi:uncharacterized protein YeaO (DUF488 family)/DNA-binding transcriptional LysR family regulator